MRGAEQAGKRLSTSVGFDEARGVTELTMFTPDHPWLLSVIAGACALAGANIVDAQIYTTTDGLALDTISISREFERDEDEARRAARIGDLIEKALRGEIKLPEIVAKRAPPKGRLKAFAIEPEVTINNQWSARYTVVEVTGLDRPGLLYELTTTLSKLNLNIASAHVATFGERVVDVFYVTDLTGAQIATPTRQAAIKRPLLALFTQRRRATPEPRGKARALTVTRALMPTLRGRRAPANRASNPPLNWALYRRSALQHAPRTGHGVATGPQADPRRRQASNCDCGRRIGSAARLGRATAPPAAAARRHRVRRRKQRRGGGRGRSGIGRLIYWGVVLALWVCIAAVARLVWIGIHLPPIQSLEIPKRPPSTLILGANGATLATRGDMGGAAVPLRELPAYVPNAFIAIEDRRFYSHYAVDPVGHLARRHHRRAAPRRLAGRLDHHPAARQESVPDPGAHADAQAAGGGAGVLARAQILQERRFSISISTASISAPALTGSKRRRSAISASRRGN